MLGTLATVYRQQGLLDECAKVLDLEADVLVVYVQQCRQEGTHRAITCCETVEFKYRIIRFNLNLQTQQYDKNVSILRQQLIYELKYAVCTKEQLYLPMIHPKSKRTLRYLQTLPDAELKRIILWMAQSEFTNYKYAKYVQLAVCAQCGTQETRTIGDYRKCSSCGAVHYCGRDCQRKHWKLSHKKDCCKKKSGTAGVSVRDLNKGEMGAENEKNGEQFHNVAIAGAVAGGAGGGRLLSKTKK